LTLNLQAIHELLQYCPRLTHLSLTGVQTFLREDLTRFCRPAPSEFTAPQRDVFCVFSGEGVSRLREYLQRLAEDQDPEGRSSRDGSGGDSEPEADSSRETTSEDGTIDARPQDMSERRPTSLPQSILYRSSGEMLSANAVGSAEHADVEEEMDGGPAIPQAIRNRVASLFRPRSGRPGSLTDHNVLPPFRGHWRSHGYGWWGGSRSVSEGEESSSRPRFARSEAPALEDLPGPSRRPLPPRPQWPPSTLAGPSSYGESQSVYASHWAPSSAGQPWAETSGAVAPTSLNPVMRNDGTLDGRGEGTEVDVDDMDDDDAETGAAQRHTSRRGRYLDDAMEP
jgi:hypothetical protein